MVAQSNTPQPNKPRPSTQSTRSNTTSQKTSATTLNKPSSANANRQVNTPTNKQTKPTSAGKTNRPTTSTRTARPTTSTIKKTHVTPNPVVAPTIEPPTNDEVIPAHRFEPAGLDVDEFVPVSIYSAKAILN